MSDTSNVQNNYLQDFWNSVLSFSSLSKNESTGKYNGLGNLAGITSATLGFISASSSKEAIKSYYGPNSNKTLNNLIDDAKGAQISNRSDYKYRQFSAKLWEAAGKTNHPIHLQIQQAIGELDAKYNFNNKVLDSANNAKMFGTLGGLLTLGDLTLAVASDDANAAAKSATTAAIGLAVGYWMIPAGLPILASVGAGIAVGYVISKMWDDYNIGGRLGLIGESLSEYAFRTIEIIHEKYNQLADATEELVDELLDDIFGAIDNLLDAFAEQVDEILDSIKDELLDEILDTVKDFFDGIQDIGFGLYLWDGFAGSNHLDDYLGFNRTGEFHVVNPDPITLDLDGDGIETVKIDGLNSILFDHDADGIATATGWVKADDGLLVLDSNGDGKIDTGRELFGDNRLLKDGSLAPTGFAALAEHDDNGDGKIDAQDAVFEQLKVWSDLNQDGVSQAEELFTLEQLGIQSLDLNHQAVNQRQGNGNSVARLGSYTTTDGNSHKMGDLLFDNNAMISCFSDEVELSAA